MDWLTGDAVDRLVAGLVVTVVIATVTMVIASVAAIVVTGARFSRRRVVRAAASVYVEVFRNVPALIQIIFWAFAFPTLFESSRRRALFFDNALWDGMRAVTDLSIPYYAVAACLALVLNTSAHLAEILRSGVASVPIEHAEAARLLGASRRRTYVSVLVPEGVRRAFPALSTRLVHNLKNTALVSFVAVPDLFHEMQASITETFRASEYLVLVALVYLVLTTALGAGLARIDRWLHKGRAPREVMHVG